MTEQALTIAGLEWDRSRGTAAMLLFILTELMLFVVLFFAYFLLADQAPAWPTEAPPKLHLALPMLAVLLSSSAVLLGAEHMVRQRRPRAARMAVAGTIALGAVFMVLQVLEFREHLRTLRPGSDAYGSIFYTITSVHAAHVGVGLLMLAYVVVLPMPGPAEKPPHRPLRNAGLYWHFVDAVWVMIVAVLYLLPRLRAG